MWGGEVKRQEGENSHGLPHCDKVLRESVKGAEY